MSEIVLREPELQRQGGSNRGTSSDFDNGPVLLTMGLDCATYSEVVEDIQRILEPSDLVCHPFYTLPEFERNLRQIVPSCLENLKGLGFYLTIETAQDYFDLIQSIIGDLPLMNEEKYRDKLASVSEEENEADFDKYHEGLGMNLVIPKEQKDRILKNWKRRRVLSGDVSLSLIHVVFGMRSQLGDKFDVRLNPELLDFFNFYSKHSKFLEKDGKSNIISLFEGRPDQVYTLELSGMNCSWWTHTCPHRGKENLHQRIREVAEMD